MIHTTARYNLFLSISVNHRIVATHTHTGAIRGKKIRLCGVKKQLPKYNFMHEIIQNKYTHTRKVNAVCRQYNHKIYLINDKRMLNYAKIPICGCIVFVIGFFHFNWVRKYYKKIKHTKNYSKCVFKINMATVHADIFFYVCPSAVGLPTFV